MSSESDGAARTSAEPHLGLALPEDGYLLPAILLGHSHANLGDVRADDGWLETPSY